MLTKRIIPCLDVKDGRVVKGIHFEGLRDVGDPAQMAKFYCEQGADELVFLDITATNEGRDTVADVVRRVAEQVTVPFAVGGGIRNEDDIARLLDAGADKVSINSAAVADRDFLARAARRFGSECIVLAIDAIRTEDGRFEVVTHGGERRTGLDAAAWAREGHRLGAGEILLTSKSADGVKEGYDIEMTRAVVQAVSIPVVASGGCGSLEDFAAAFEQAGADAALAASLFHYGEVTVPEVKAFLKARSIAVR